MTWGAICPLKINIWRNNLFFSPFCSAKHYCLVSVSFSRSLTLIGLTLTSGLPLGDTMVTSPWEEENALHETGSHSQDSRPQSGQHVMSLSDILERFKALTCLWENNWGVGRACFVNLLLNSMLSPIKAAGCWPMPYHSFSFERPRRNGLTCFSLEIYMQRNTQLSYIVQMVQ